MKKQLALIPQLLIRLVLLLFVVLYGSLAHAQSDGLPKCSVSSSGVLVTYDPLATAANVSSSTVTISCTRNRSDNTSFNWSLAANFGLNPSGTTRRAKRDAGPELISYQLFRNSAYSQIWGTASGDRFSGYIDFGNSETLSTTRTITYYSRIPALQSVPAGEYKDTVTMTFYMNDIQHSTNTFPLTIKINGVCSISSSPGNIQFHYTSFQQTAATTSTSFAVTCSSGTLYTMSLDATSGTLLGLSYALSINPVGTQTGTGSAQLANINGTIAAGQSGRCSQSTCTAAEPRILTISY